MEDLTTLQTGRNVLFPFLSMEGATPLVQQPHTQETTMPTHGVQHLDTATERGTIQPLQVIKTLGVTVTEIQQRGLAHAAELHQDLLASSPSSIWELSIHPAKVMAGVPSGWMQPRIW